MAARPNIAGKLKTGTLGGNPQDETGPKSDGWAPTFQFPLLLVVIVSAALVQIMVTSAALGRDVGSVPPIPIKLLWLMVKLVKFER